MNKFEKSHIVKTGLILAIIQQLYFTSVYASHCVFLKSTYTTEKIVQRIPEHPIFTVENSANAWINGTQVIYKKSTLASMTGRISRFKVKGSYLPSLKIVLRRYVNEAIKQKGNIMTELYYERDTANVLWLIERWADQTQMDFFEKSPSGKALSTFLAKPVSIEDKREYIITDLEPLNKEQWRKTSSKRDRQLTVMLFVESKEGTQDSFKKIYHNAMPQFREEKGVVTYQLSQIKGSNTLFVTYEKFRSPEAFEYHLKFPPIRAVVDYLETQIKHLPFQRNLHNLIQIAPKVTKY